MIRVLPSVSALILLGVLACAPEASPSADDSIPVATKGEVGLAAPRYEAVTLRGDSVSLASYRGKVVLLNAWATWCGPCRQEIPELRILHSKYAKEGLTVIGVTVDTEGTEQQVADFVREFKMDYPLWHDPAERISAQFAISGLPASFLIDRRGIIRWKATGAVQVSDTSLQQAIRASLEAKPGSWSHRPAIPPS